MSLASELLRDLEPEIEAISLVPSEGGAYEVTINDRLVYSKLQTGRHAEPGEVLGLVREMMKK